MKKINRANLLDVRIPRIGLAAQQAHVETWGTYTAAEQDAENRLAAALQLQRAAVEETLRP